MGTSREFRATRSKSASSFSLSEVRDLDFICNSLALAIVRLYLAGNVLPRVTKLVFFGLHRVHSRLCACFRQHNCKLVAAVARRRTDVPAEAQNIGHPADRMASRQMPVAVVDLLQSIQVKQQQGKLPPGAC